jgi:hypothetical protein
MTAESQQPTGHGPSAREPLPHAAGRQGSAGQGKPGSLQAAADSVGRQNQLDSTPARTWSGPGSDGASRVEYKAFEGGCPSRRWIPAKVLPISLAVMMTGPPAPKLRAPCFSRAQRRTALPLLGSAGGPAFR